MKRTILIVSLSALVVCIVGYNIFLTNVGIHPESVVDAAEIASVHDAAATTQGPIQILEADELMKLLVDPMFEDLKDAIENPPEKRKHWRSLYIAAFNLAEVNNLTFSRTGNDYMETEEWTAEIVKARGEVIDLAETIRTRPEYAELKEKFIVVMQSCNDCHVKFSADEDIDEIEGPLSWKQ